MRSSMNYIYFGDIVEANGRTIRENNTEIPHNLRVGQLVEVKYDEWHGGGACSKVHARLWIVLCGRDCDGTPLYWLAATQCYDYGRLTVIERMMVGAKGGFAESSLTPVQVTPELEYGTGSLEWHEDA
jgi:hypothetical protein